MDRDTIQKIAEGYGLTVEAMAIPENENAFRVYKGAKQLFIGSEAAVREFLTDYVKERPGLLEGSMYGYKE